MCGGWFGMRPLLWDAKKERKKERKKDNLVYIDDML